MSKKHRFLVGTSSLAFWLYNHTGNPELLEYIEYSHDHSFDWSGFFSGFPWDTDALEKDRIPYHWGAKEKTAHGPLRIGKNYSWVVTSSYYCFPNEINYKGNADWEIRPLLPGTTA